MTDPPRLPALYRQLVRSPRGATAGSFLAIPIPGVAGHRLAVSAQGEPALLFAVQAGGQPRPPLRLANITVDYALRCVTEDPSGAAHEGLFSVVCCTADDPDLTELFLEFASAVLASLTGQPADASPAHAIAQLAELFRALSKPASRTVLGLWGELFLIAGASRPADLLAAWHAVPTERYDFSAGPNRLDVKTTSGPVRRHDFSLAQLCPPPGARAVIASILVDPSAGGLSVSDLLARIQRAPGVSPDALVALQLQVADALGADWPDAASQRYDAQQAAGTLAFYAAEDIPTIPPPPPQVTNVRFTADISDVRQMPFDVMRAHQPLFDAAAPRA